MYLHIVVPGDGNFMPDQIIECDHVAWGHYSSKEKYEELNSELGVGDIKIDAYTPISGCHFVVVEFYQAERQHRAILQGCDVYVMSDTGKTIESIHA